jgi:hypothetical protein
MQVLDCQCVCVRVTIVSPNKPATLDKKYEDDFSCTSVRFLLASTLGREDRRHTVKTCECPLEDVPLSIKSAVVFHLSTWHIFLYDVKPGNTATVIFFNSVYWRVTDTVRRHHLYSSYCIGQDLNYSIDF